MYVSLRPWRREDAAELARFSNNPKIAVNLTDRFPSPYTLADAECFLDGLLQGDGSLFCRAILADGQIVGIISVTVGSDVYRKGGELGYCLDVDWWGRGVMSRALAHMCTLAFRTLDLERLFAAPFARNGASCRVLEKGGFTLEGTLRSNVYKQGVLCDTKVYSLLREEWAAAPTLETERLVLRPFSEKDAADVYAYAKDPEVGPAAGWPPHKDEGESLEIIRTAFAAPHVLALERKEDGRVVGSVGLVGRHRTELPGPDDELGYALGSAYWGRGLMPEAAAEVLRYGFEDLGLETVWCGYYEGNDKSRRVVEKCGFQYQFSGESDVELLGERRLEHHYALSREAWRARRTTG